jgi:hypothetical protein
MVYEGQPVGVFPVAMPMDQVAANQPKKPGSGQL